MSSRLVGTLARALLAGLLFGLATTAHALKWPFDPQTTPPDIASILGDWNGNILHDGIDFQKPIGTPVKAIEDGFVLNISIDETGSDGRIVIGAAANATEGWSYGHLTFPQEIRRFLEIGKPITAGQHIGDVADFRDSSFDHLHLERAAHTMQSIPKNPFGFFALSELPPMEPLLNASDIFFVPDKTADKLSFPNQVSGAPTVIKGDVDILAEGHNKVGALSSPGVYTASYFIKDAGGATVLAERTQVVFNEFPFAAETGKFGIVYGLGSSEFRGHYRVTNSGTQPPASADGTSNAIENAWFTKVRGGVNDDGSVALAAGDMATAPAESKYPDGNYTVGVRVGAFTGTPKLVARKVTVENFRPATAKTVIRDSKGTIRQFLEWLYDAIEKKYKKVVPRDPVALGPDTYTIEIQFSEPVQNPTLSIDTLGPLGLTSSEPAEQQRNFTATLVIDANSTIQDGLRTLTITAQDLAGVDLLALGPNDTEINPATQLARAADGSFGGVGGADTSVSFAIASPDSSTRTA